MSASERLYFVDTESEIGDGASPMTTEDWMAVLDDLLTSGNADEQGVLPGVRNELAVSGATSPLSVATGAALVNGRVYRLTGDPASLAVASPLSGTTGGRVVVRYTAATNVGRVTAYKNSTDGNSAPPPLVQDADYWDVPLATFTITTGGAITLTDDRHFCTFATRVALGNLESGVIDQSVVGDGILAGSKRIGGSSTNFATGGFTEYDLGAIRVLVAAFDVTMSGGTAIIDTPLTFPTDYFSDVPTILGQGVQTEGTGYAIGNTYLPGVFVEDLTAAGCTVWLQRDNPASPTGSLTLTVSITFVGAK